MSEPLFYRPVHHAYTINPANPVNQLADLLHEMAIAVEEHPKSNTTRFQFLDVVSPIIERAALAKAECRRLLPAKDQVFEDAVDLIVRLSRCRLSTSPLVDAAPSSLKALELLDVADAARLQLLDVAEMIDPKLYLPKTREASEPQFYRADYRNYSIDPATLANHIEAFIAAIKGGDPWHGWLQFRYVVAPDTAGSGQIIERSSLPNEVKDRLQEVRETAMEGPYRISERKRQIVAALRGCLPSTDKRPQKPIDPQTTVWFHGERQYSIDGNTPYKVSQEHDSILQAFLESKQAMETRDLEDKSGSTNASRAIKALSKWMNGIFSAAIRIPQGKAMGGYFIRVLDARKSL